MDLLQELNEDFRAIARKNFSPQIVLKANRLLNESRVSISFKRGSPDRFFVVSGIIKDDQTAESKITYKKNEGEHRITSQCNCLSWSKEHHCSHTATLFIKFHLLNKEISDLPDILQNNLINDGSVSVQEYGTIIPGPEFLRGRGIKAHSTYFAYQYQLTNKKSCNFPVPSQFEEKLRIRLYPTYKFLLKKADIQIEEIPRNLYSPRFSIIDRDGNEIKETSLMEHLYIFNWVTGISYNQSDKITALIQKLKRFNFSLTIDDYLNLASPLLESGQIELFVDDDDIYQSERCEVNYQITIQESERKNHFDIKINAFNESQRTCEFVSDLAGLNFTSGFLDSFKTKIQGYEFVNQLSYYVFDEENKLSQIIRSSSQRQYIEKIVENISSRQNLLSYSVIDKKIYEFPIIKFFAVIKNMITYFGENAFRFSSLTDEGHCIQIEVRQSKVLPEVSNFYEKINPFQIAIYFNQKKIESWRSSIKFNRRNSEIDWFGIEFEVTEEDLEIIKKADLDSSQVLTNSGLTILTKEQKSLLKFLKRYVKSDAEAIDGTGGKRKYFKLPFQRSRIFELFELKKLGVEGILTEKEEEFCNKLLNLESIPEYPLLDHYQNLMRPYQEEGYHWLRFLHENKFGACLADDMGLGKTLQTITFVESILAEDTRCLIVCPVSILMNWKQEFDKFSKVSDEISIYYGGDREYDPTKKIILTSYGVMKKESQSTLGETNFDLLILDEVQNLKNIRSQGAIAARNINAKFRVCLTGTPVENDLSEFYNIMDLSVPGIWGSAEYIKSKSVKKTRLIARNTARPFILRRTKKQVLDDLPPKIENTVYLKFSDFEKENYLFNLSKIRKKISNVTSKQKYGEVLKGLLELRQLCLWQNQQESMSTKVKYLLKNIEQIIEENHQVLIFSQFTTYLDKIQKEIQERGITFSRIDGSFSLKKREQNIKKFQDGNTKIFLISLKAGGLGLNLTAASYIYLMDPWWNPAVESQAIDRAHRIGQKNSVNVYRLIMKDTIEEKVLKLQEIKKELFNELLDSNSDEYFTGKLTMRDFEMLLSPEP